jgi:RNA polymerase sigma-70 factor (ECF subfamily)
VVQEVFRAVWQNVARFRRSQPGDSFRGWMWRIAHSKAMDHFRRAKSEPQGVGGSDFQKRLLGVADPAAAQSNSAVGASPAGEENALVHRAVQSIRSEFDPRTWELFERTTVRGERAVDVGTELGVQPSAVRQAKYRVVRRLRHVLAELCNLGEGPSQEGNLDAQ